MLGTRRIESLHVDVTGVGIRIAADLGTRSLRKLAQSEWPCDGVKTRIGHILISGFGNLDARQLLVQALKHQIGDFERLGHEDRLILAQQEGEPVFLGQLDDHLVEGLLHFEHGIVQGPVQFALAPLDRSLQFDDSLFECASLLGEGVGRKNGSLPG